MKMLLAPGELVANAFGLPREAEHRIIFRTFFNTLFWGVIGSSIALSLAV